MRKRSAREIKEQQTADEVRKCLGENHPLYGMAIWFRLGVAENIKARTPEQRAWDSAIGAAAEYLRRNGYENAGKRLFDLQTPVLG